MLRYGLSLSNLLGENQCDDRVRGEELIRV